ncbi:MAG: ectoine hydroxylase [Kofleriaceae bacterium]
MAGLATDPYRSRIAERWEFAPRVDPVVWPSLAEAAATAGPLDGAALARYDRDGFLVLPGLIGPDELTALVAETDRLVAAADPGRDDVVVEPGGAAVRSVFRVHRTSPVMARLCAASPLAQIAGQLLGGEVYVHQSRINLKPAFAGRPFPWHSDFETWHSEDGMPRMRALSASILLTENTPHNGPLMLVPGSHRRFVRCQGETPDQHFRQSLRNQAYGVPDPAALTTLVADGGIASVVGPPGTVVIFDCNVMHGSAGNITPAPRHNIFVCFNSTANRLVRPFGGTPPRPAFLAEREPLALVG